MLNEVKDISPTDLSKKCYVQYRDLKGNSYRLENIISVNIIAAVNYHITLDKAEPCRTPQKTLIYTLHTCSYES